MTPQQLQQAQLQQAQQQALARTAAESSVAPPLHTYTSSSTTATFASAAAAAGPYGTAPLPPGYSSASGSPASGPGGYPGGSVSAAAGGRGLPLTSLSAIHGLPAAGATAAGGEPWRAPAQSLGTLAAAAAAARGVGLGGPNAWRLRAEVIDTPLLKPSVIARNNRCGAALCGSGPICRKPQTCFGGWTSHSVAPLRRSPQQSCRTSCGSLILTLGTVHARATLWAPHVSCCAAGTSAAACNPSPAGRTTTRWPATAEPWRCCSGPSPTTSR